jgi:hypothetical protein
MTAAKNKNITEDLIDAKIATAQFTSENEWTKNVNKKIKSIEKKIQTSSKEVEDRLSKRITEGLKEVKEIKSFNQNATTGVLVASVLILVTIATEIVIYHSGENETLIDINNKINEHNKSQALEIENLKTELKLLKAKNTYLK